MRVVAITLMIIVSSLIVSAPLFAQTDVSGSVEGEWTAEDAPYLVIDDIFLERENELSIEAGVEVVFVDDFVFGIHGTLTAEGSEDDSIRFDPSDQDGRWKGLRFIDAVECRLSYCVITNGRRGEGEGEPGDPNRSGGNIFIAESEVLIENSRISNGFAGGFGGGIAVWAAEPVIRNCIISENQSMSQGGGINLNRGAHARIENCIISDNNAQWAGGAINIEEDSDPVIEGCLLIGNSAVTGGGVSLYGGDPVIRHTKFIENSAQVMGGGAYLRNEGNDAVVEWCDFIRNRAEGGEGALGGGVLLRFNTGSEIKFCRFIENSARLGGGIYVQQEREHAPQCAIHHSLFLRNTALAGGALSISANCGRTPLTLEHCTFLGNMSHGEEITCAFIPEGSWMSFNSCIIWGPPHLIWNPERAYVEYCQIRGGFPGEGNSEENPGLFEIDSSWALLRGDSPCVNTGAPYLPDDGDDSRNDRGWMYYPHNVRDYLDAERVSTELSVGERVVETLTLHSESDVPFFANVADRWRLAEPDESVEISEITDDGRIMCAAFTGDGFQVAGGNNGDEENMMYVLSRDFELIEMYDQPGGDQGDGFIDLGYDGESTLYGGHIYIMEFAVDGEWGELYGGSDTIDVFRGVAVDYTYSEDFLDFYFAGDEGVIVRAGDEMFEQERWIIPVPVKSMAMRGNRRSLFIVTGPPNLDILAEFDIETGVLSPLYALSQGEDEGRLTGIEVTQEWEDGQGTLIAIRQGEGDAEDRLLITDLYTSWLAPESDLKLVFPGDEVFWDILFAGDHVEEGEYSTHFYLSVNGWGEDGELTAEVNAHPSSIDGNATGLPQNFRIEAVYPNPFNNRTTVGFIMPQAGLVNAGVYDLAGRRVLPLWNGMAAPGRNIVTLDGKELISGEYFIIFEGVNKRYIERVTLIR